MLNKYKPKTYVVSGNFPFFYFRHFAFIQINVSSSPTSQCYIIQQAVGVRFIPYTRHHSIMSLFLLCTQHKRTKNYLPPFWIYECLWWFYGLYMIHWVKELLVRKLTHTCTLHIIHTHDRHSVNKCFLPLYLS